MREHKFRAWDKIEKVMKLPTLLKLGRESPFIDENNNGKVYQIQCNGKENIEYFNHRIVLMEYTGLKDQNGKEIYEGDIVKFADWSPKIVIYKDTSFAGYSLKETSLWLMEYDMDRFEVIGNIFENPDLLEAAK